MHNEILTKHEHAYAKAKATPKSAYALRAETKRFAIYREGKWHGETVDYDQSLHVQRLLQRDGYEVQCVVLDANQQAPATYPEPISSCPSFYAGWIRRPPL